MVRTFVAALAVLLALAAKVDAEHGTPSILEEPECEQIVHKEHYQQHSVTKPRPFPPTDGTNRRLPSTESLLRCPVVLCH